MAIRKYYIVPFILMLVVAGMGIFYPTSTETLNAGDPINQADTAWMLVASALVLIMTPGLGFFYGGMANKKSIISTVLQSVISLGVISILWVVVGFSLAFGDSIGGVIGNPLTFFMFNNVGTSTHTALSPTVPLLLFAFFQLKFAIITPALITGSFTERVKFNSYLLFIVLFSIFIYSPLAHMTWHPDGLLRKWGVLDFAGGTVVHMSAGIAALTGAMFLGRREVHGKSDFVHLPSNIPYVIIGTGLLWFGWFGFNAGSALAANELAVSAFANTNTAAAAAMMTWIFFDAVRGHKVSAVGACVGAVVGLVAITPACGFVTLGQSLTIGVLSAIVSNMAVHWKNRSNLDDTLDVFPCHGVGGIMGMIFTGVFANEVGLIHGVTDTFLKHMAALFIVSAFAFIGSWVLYKITDLITPLRVSKDEESQGLDISQHGEEYNPC
jgi:ammonium transporter, Amt family